MAQIEENKRILKELEDQKRQLKSSKSSQHMVMPPGAPAQPQSRPNALEMNFPATSSRHSHNRQALYDASSNSFGHYISTDSQFGNPILAVLPRPENTEKKSPS